MSEFQSNVNQFSNVIPSTGSNKGTNQVNTTAPTTKAKKLQDRVKDPNCTASTLIVMWTAPVNENTATLRTALVTHPNADVAIFSKVTGLRDAVERNALLNAMAKCNGESQISFMQASNDQEVQEALFQNGPVEVLNQVIANGSFFASHLPKLVRNPAFHTKEG